MGIVHAGVGAAALIIGGAQGPIEGGHVRSTTPAIVAAIEEGLGRSDTFRRLMAQLDSSTVIVYFEPGSCPRRARSCLFLLSTTGSIRYLRAHMNTAQNKLRLVEQIGHELQHALEVAEAPEVTSVEAFIQLFTRLSGKHCLDFNCYETKEAQAVEKAIRRDLAVAAAGGTRAARRE